MPKSGVLQAILVLALLVPSCSKQTVFTIEENEIQTDDVVLHSRFAGDPDAKDILIAVHGGPGGSSGYLIGLDTLRGGGFAVVTYDQRGSGRSGTPSGGYALLDHVGDIEAIRRSLGVDQILLFGHSWGGVIALRYATVHPERVRAIVLMGSGPPAASVVFIAQSLLVQKVLSLQEQGLIPRQLPSDGQDFVHAILPAYFSDPVFRPPQELQEMWFNQAVADSTIAALGQDWDFSEELGKLEHPVLMFWGEDDPFGEPMADATRNALSSAKVRFVLLEDCGHYWHECETEFYPIVRAFLGLPAASPAD
jgi:proline-specific peptidase